MTTTTFEHTRTPERTQRAVAAPRRDTRPMPSVLSVLSDALAASRAARQASPGARVDIAARFAAGIRA